MHFQNRFVVVLVKISISRAFLCFCSEGLFQMIKAYLVDLNTKTKSLKNKLKSQ